MHEIQRKLLDLSQKKSLVGLTLREIGKVINVKHPQLIRHHLNQLIKKGILCSDYSLVGRVSSIGTEVINVPIFGSANCGEPTMLAEENLEGYLKISSSLMPLTCHKDLFALKAVGDSMDEAKVVKTDSINDGDYVIVNKSDTQPSDGDYVVSIIEGAANIKKIIFDKEKPLIYLLSESTKDYPPIVISATDNFLVNGKVIKVIKTPKVGNLNE